MEYFIEQDKKIKFLEIEVLILKRKEAKLEKKIDRKNKKTWRVGRVYSKYKNFFFEIYHEKINEVKENVFELVIQKKQEQ